MPEYAAVIAQAVAEGDNRTVVETLRQALDQGASPDDLLSQGLIPGIQQLGAKFKGGEVFLPEILISVRAMKQGLELLKPLFSAQQRPASRGTIVIGTVAGDNHDIGKNLVRMMLESHQFEVIDLGVDVPPAAFVKTAQEHGAALLAVSALLTTTMTGIPEVLGLLTEAGLRDKVKMMIGGAPITREFADLIGVEGFAPDCVTAVDEARRLLGAGD